MQLKRAIGFIAMVIPVCCYPKWELWGFTRLFYQTLSLLV